MIKALAVGKVVIFSTMYNKGSNPQETQNPNFEWFVVKFIVYVHSAFKVWTNKPKDI